MTDASEYKILIGGDILPSDGNIELFETGNTEDLFGREICDLFRLSDYSIVNLEGPLTDSIIQQKKAGPVIKASTKSVNALKKLGVTSVCLANNHVTDYCQKGYEDTICTIEKAGIDYCGAGLKDNVKTHLTIKLGDRSVCVYCVSETFFNEPTEVTAGANLYDEYLVCNELKDLKKENDYIIVLYHGGAEYLQYPTPIVRKRFQRMADCGADLIVAQHTHCIGCEEYYHGAYFLYGQGNFLFARQKKYPQLTKEGLLLEICFGNQINIHKYAVKVTDSKVRINEAFDYTSFIERNSDVNNEEMIISKYMAIKSDDIMNNYLISYKGQYPLRRILFRLSKKYVYNLHKTYSEKQILKNMSVVKGERRREDMYYVWRYIYEQYEQRGK